ncbi:MFS transporter [Paraburkholderia megapolitana]|uniref:MFS transporter, putative metabolite:H+ symporter n=1 Tax=Paraburkholderia megapolitana TaxID=420953 RepID=A0A1I3GP16_9BURK|nr:MFS transporter [Paraburkholderia megapolitana]QDQ82991.1 MFS transporter [Paraburkholderia megapolitana]SFI25215.1 MFS transporter, putative metabolite:H+ symporter [Paraburkholderia megapolitana]
MTSISARIERMPFARFHRRLLLMGGLGYTFDAMDAAVLAFLLPVLRQQWHLTSVQTGVLGSGTFIGYFVGAMLAGMLGDLIGRRHVMMWALVIYCVASLASATAHDWPFFLATRIVAGLGTGAESAIVAPFLSEFVARRYRGAFTGSLAGFFSFGFVAAALLGYFVIPLGSEAWRVVMVITALPIVMLLWWRRALPESPRWLEACGRHAEAEAIIAAAEAEMLAEGIHLDPLPPDAITEGAVPIAAERASVVANVKALWSRSLARITAMTWLMWLSITFSYYAFFTWIPGLLVQSGMTITRSFSYSLVMYLAQIPGYFSGAWLNEKIGRQATIASYMVLGGVSALGLALTRSDAGIMASGVLLSFFMNGTYAGVYAYTPEVFPTDVRATGSGLASSIGRLGAIAAPILVGYLYPVFGFAGVFGATTTVLLVGALAVVLMGVPTRGRSLEDIAAQQLHR